MKRVLLALLAAFLASPAAAMDVSHYFLDLQVFPESQTIEAMASIELTVAAEDLVAGKFPLNFRGLNVTMVGVDGLVVDYEHTGGLLVVGLPDGMGPGNHQVEVHYFGTPSPYDTDWGTWGMVFDVDRVFTVNVVEGAQTWFPCHDVLTDKATFELFVTVPEQWSVAAPGELLAATTGEGRWSFHWLANWNLPTYLMHFATAPYTVVEETHDGVPFLYHLYPTAVDDAQETLQHAPQAVALFTGLYGDYPFPKVGFNEINLGGAVEQPSSVSIGTQIFAAPEDFAEVVAHEMAHSWFQGVVTIAEWKDLWLSEGLATYHEVLYFAHLNGDEAGQTYARSLALSYRTTAQMNEGFFPLYDPEQMWGVTVYRKGAMVFHMLRFLVGDETFFAILNQLLETYGGSTASTADFQAVAEAVWGQSLQPFFDEWVYGTGYPQLDVAWRWTGQDLAVMVTQTQPEAWGTYSSVPVPLRVAGVDDARFDTTITLDGRVTEVSVAVPFEPEALLVDPDGWLLLKASAVDYPESPVEVVDVAEAVDLPEVIAEEVVEVLGASDGVHRAEVVDGQVVKRGDGGCSASGPSTPWWPLLLLLLYGLQGLRRRSHAIGHCADK